MSTSELVLERTEGPFGVVVHDLDLSRPVSGPRAEALRAAWLEHQVLVFPEQRLGSTELEAVAATFGPIGEDPFFRPMPGESHVVALTREADETTPLFADVLHSDWSFLATPPAGTLLYGVDIPPAGGDTLFVDQHGAYEDLPDRLKERLEGLQGVHSARRGYARDGLYGDRDEGRSMAIVASDEALATQLHPLVRTHPETGRKALFASLAYTIGIEGMDDDEANLLLGELSGYQSAEARTYRHRWSPGMVVLWDNRCLLHAATGGYEGHRRELHRLTVAERAAG